MKKKLLALMLCVTVVMSMTACGGSESDNSSPASTVEEDAPEQEAEVEEEDDAAVSELVYSEANGVQIALPADLKMADGGVEGMAIFTNTNQTEYITITGPFTGTTLNPDEFTDEAFAVLLEAGGYGDVTVDSSGIVDQPDGATTATVFARGSMNGGDVQNIVMQYYFMADGSGNYVITYIYPLDDIALDDVITEILASVTVAE